MKANLRYYLFFLFLCESLIAQQLASVDFYKIDTQMEIFPSQKRVQGTLAVTFKILKQTDSIFLDAKNMKAVVNKYSNTGVELTTTQQKIWLKYPFQENKEYTVSIDFEVSPQQSMYFFENQVWTQGQGKYTSHWLPSVDDENDKIIFNFKITAPLEMVVLSNGALTKEVLLDQGKKQWNYVMKKPMSSYLVAIAMGNFIKKQEQSQSGIDIEYYLPRQFENNFEATFRHTKTIFDYFEHEIGVPFPWQNYKQVAVRDFLYAGMENTSLTIFAEAFVVDSIGFFDRNYVNVNAHELAHQWFGNLVTAKSSKHHWLQEGFATYYALLAERQIFGEDYYYWKLYQSAEQLAAMSEQGNGEPLLKEGASALTYYQKGAWALHILREKIGDLVFKKAVSNFLKKHQFKTATTADFIKEISLLNGDSLQWFKNQWLLESTFNSPQAFESLSKSKFIKNYLQLTDLSNRPFLEKEKILHDYLSIPVHNYLGQEVVFQLVDVPFAESNKLYEKALKSKNSYLAQAVAMSLEKIPIEFQEAYETLLEAPSYSTREVALYHLWLNFPEKRAIYLYKMKNMIGFQDKNIRQLWLTLAILTDNFEENKKNSYFEELSSYTSNAYSFEIRQIAFQYIYGIDGFTANNLINLIDACFHPNWRFSKNSKELLKLLIENKEIKNRLIQLKNQLSTQKKEWLATYLNQ